MPTSRWLEFLGNIVPVSLGNVVGGVSLGAAYWLTYRSDCRPAGSQHQERRNEVVDLQSVLQLTQRESREAT
jgi:hypothetical protein